MSYEEWKQWKAYCLCWPCYQLPTNSWMSIRNLSYLDCSSIISPELKPAVLLLPPGICVMPHSHGCTTSCSGNYFIPFACAELFAVGTSIICIISPYLWSSLPAPSIVGLLKVNSPPVNDTDLLLC